MRLTILPAVFPSLARLAASCGGVRHELLPGGVRRRPLGTILRNVSAQTPIPGDHPAVRATEIYALCLGTLSAGEAAGGVRGRASSRPDEVLVFGLAGAEVASHRGTCLRV
ncbi:MAG TPA: hypothetical protein VF838_04135 [Trebonia sp.]